MTTRPPLDPTIVYREYVSQLSRGRGASRRVGEIFSISRQRVDQIVAKHEAAHPLPHLVRNTPDAPSVRPEPSQVPSESLQYEPPPGGYPTPEPLPIPVLNIMSPPLLPIAPYMQEAEFNSYVFPVQLQVAVASASKRRRRVQPGEWWLLSCFGLTLVAVAMGSQDVWLGLSLLFVAQVMWGIRI